MKRTSVPWLALATLLLAAIVVLVGTYAFLPSLIEGAVARSVQDRLGLAEPPEVELQVGSLPETLAGEFSGAEISLEGTDVGSVRAEQVVLNLNPFDLDVPRSLSAGAPRAEEPVSGTLRATLSEAEVLSVVRDAAAEVPVRDLRLEDGRVVVDSEVAVLGFTVPVSVQGELVLRGQSLVFEPRRVAALGSEVPEELASEVLEGVDLSYPLEGLPAGVEVEDLEVEENRLVLDGVVERIPLQAG